MPTAISLYIYINAIFVWAGKRKPWRLLFEINPAEEMDLDRMLPAGYQSWCERALAAVEIIELRNRFETIQNTWKLHAGPRRGRIAKPIPHEHVLGCWIMLATLARINELCAARWKEHINFKAATWFIPSGQAKNRKAITIHLSRFALRLLRELYAITGRTPFLLPHPDDATAPCTTAVLQCAIVARQSWGKWKKKSRNAEITATSLMLSAGPWSCHDLRRRGCTLMQACGIDERIVDRCLNHSIATQAKKQAINPRLMRTCQRYDYAREMSEAWDRLGEYLTNLDGALTQIDGPDAIVVANDNTDPLPQIAAA